jgi:hypothetical protein
MRSPTSTDQSTQHAPALDTVTFEQPLADLAADFINLPDHRIDDAIVASLRRILAMLDVDRIDC